MGGTIKKKALPRRAKVTNDERVLLLRTCSQDGTSYGGFQWPLTVGAEVIAPDWSPRAVCGLGLHGLLWGEGDGNLLSWASDAVWMVISARASDVVSLNGKVKVPSARVECVGDRLTATAYLAAHGGGGRAIAGGTATAGYGGTATAGDGGTATAGYGGTATAGYCGTATAGKYGTATAGDRGTVIVTWHDGMRSRVSVGYIGENGLKADTAYRLDASGAFVEAK